MIQCPECREMILEDSAFCDKCGKELKWCPECKRPKRGTECPVCGNDLIPGRKYLAMIESGQTPSAPQQPVKVDPKPQNTEPVQQPVVTSSPVNTTAPQQPQRTAVAAAVALPTALVGNGWRLQLQEGAFGRVGGMWPELGTCTYVSSNHGVIGRTPTGWTITDNGTTNGTYVNGARLAAGTPVAIAKGNSVRIATLEFTVE